MRIRALMIGLALSTACADSVDGLGPGATQGAAADAGVQPADSGPASDAGAPVVDGGAVVPDAGPPPGCPSGWTTIASTTEAQGIQTESFAALEQGYAVTWSVFDENWAADTYLQFFDPALAPRGPAQRVAPGSRVVAVDGRFLRGGPGGIEWYGADGTPGDTVNVGLFIPSAVVGGRVYGGVLRDASGPAPAVLVDDFTQVRVFSVAVSFEGKVVFGEDRMVVVEGAQTGAAVRLFSLVDDEASLLAEHMTVPVEVEGVRWLPTQLSAGVWNEGLGRFELLFAVNMSNGRFFGPGVFSLTDTMLVEGPLLLEPRVEVSHGSLEGAVALSAGQLAIAYNDTYPQSDVELSVVIGGSAQTFPIGANIRSQPLFASTPEGLAILSAHHPGGAGFWETELQIRCDLF